MPRSHCLALILACGSPCASLAASWEPGDFEPSRTPARPVSSGAPAQPDPVPIPAVAPSGDQTTEQSADRPLPADVRLGSTEASLFLRDGRRFTGVLMAHDGRTITLRISGIDTRFAAAEVERVRFVVPAAELFAKLKAAVPENDLDSLVRLITWVAERGELELAARELDMVLLKSPDHVRARTLLSEVSRQLGLRRQAEPEPVPENLPEPEAAQPATSAARVPTLSPEQVNLIKVYEIDLTASPTVSIPREVMVRALEAKAGHPLAPATREARDAVLRASPVQQLDLLFRLRAREFYPDVRVHGSPQVLRRFADEVHRPILLGGCATSECHGGTEAGRLMFATHRPSSDATVYTNFYILENYRTADGRALINWQEPDQSVFLQMGLPREFATAKHPPVPRGPGGADLWKPVVRSASEQRFKNAAAWVRAMIQPRPDYGLRYEPLRPLTPPQGAVRQPDSGR